VRHELCASLGTSFSICLYHALQQQNIAEFPSEMYCLYMPEVPRSSCEISSSKNSTILALMVSSQHLWHSLLFFCMRTCYFFSPCYAAALHSELHVIFRRTWPTILSANTSCLWATRSPTPLSLLLYELSRHEIVTLFHTHGRTRSWKDMQDLKHVDQAHSGKNNCHFSLLT
jgi:hypothetical protein